VSLDRREFLNLAAAGLATGFVMSASHASARAGSPIKAIAFDAFAIFDPRAVYLLAEQFFPGKGADLSNAWRTRQFEYQWLRALSGDYVDFWQATEDALAFSADLLKLDLSRDRREQLMDAYLRMKAWPDASLALQAFRNNGIRLAILSNATPAILDAGIKNSGLEAAFEHVLSTDTIRTYKPDPRAYRMAIEAFDLRREDILFVAFGGWDAAGSRAFGYRTFWVNRLGLPLERLGAGPDAIGRNLADLAEFVDRQRTT